MEFWRPIRKLVKLYCFPKKEAVAEGIQMVKEQAMVCENLAVFRQPSVLAQSTVLLMHVLPD